MCNMLLVSVLFHLFPLWVWANNIPTRRLDLNSRFCSARISSQCYPLSRSRLHFFFSAIRHFFFHSACSFFPIHPFSLSFCFGFFLCCLLAFECSLHLHREIYTISLILIGYDDLVWRTKTKNQSSVFGAILVGFGFDSLRISVCIYLYT